MLFNSIEYLFFYPLVVALYFSISNKHRWIFLLLSSYIFYMFLKAEYIIILIAITLINYFIGKGLFNSESNSQRKVLLTIGLTSSLLILFVFKYSNFIIRTTRDILLFCGINLEIGHMAFVLPVGISFYTFQTMGYIIDIYHRRIKSESNIGIFALYVSFFPQLLAGPIGRAKDLIPQLRVKHFLNHYGIRQGLQLILWGMIKKTVIAERLAVYVDKVFGSPHLYDGGTLTVATIFFSIQIYCDFSGYTDIAIGSAKIIGIDLTQNFKRPYLAKSLGEFWRRWHISLSTWFRDYVYIQLGGNKVTISRWCKNILIVFVLCGLWHGSAWTFVIWAILHGLALIIERLFIYKIGQVRLIKHLAPRQLLNAISIVATVSFVSFSWIFFRANTVNDAFLIIERIMFGWGEFYIGNPSNFVYSLFGIVLVIASDVNGEWLKGRLSLFENKYRTIRHASYAIAIIIILLIGVLDEGQFIYFQF